MAISNRDRAELLIEIKSDCRASSFLVEERLPFQASRTSVTAVIPQSPREKIMMLAWLTEQLNIPFEADYAYPIGFAKGDELIAVVAFHDYRPPDIHLSVAATTPRWMTRANLDALWRYCFDFLKCTRVTATPDKSNKHARSILTRLGFQLEGVLRHQRSNGEDCCLYGLLKEEYRIGRTINNG